MSNPSCANSEYFLSQRFGGEGDDGNEELQICQWQRQGNRDLRYLWLPIFTLRPSKPEYAWVKAGIIHQSEIVRPTYENWVKDKVKWAVITVSERNEEGRKT